VPVRQIDYTAALVAGDTVVGWGSNNSGQLGVPASDVSWTSVPIVAQGIEGTPIGIAKGSAFACALVDDGRVQCWGENYRGELGRGSTGEPNSNPADVVGLFGPAVEICISGSTACVLMDDGSIMCWGDGDDGKLGNSLDSMECPEWDSCLFPTPVSVIGFGPEE
jgi:alpha-tubulin suppressor-like RCC1 family protein